MNVKRSKNDGKRKDHSLQVDEGEQSADDSRVKHEYTNNVIPLCHNTKRHATGGFPGSLNNNYIMN